MRVIYLAFAAALTVALPVRGDVILTYHLSSFRAGDTGRRIPAGFADTC